MTFTWVYNTKTSGKLVRILREDEQAYYFESIKKVYGEPISE